MTGAENERLAVVETKLTAVMIDVAEVKTDVKALLVQRAEFSGAGHLIARIAPWAGLVLSIVVFVIK